MTTKQVQNLLQYLGYYAIRVDGISGPGTVEAIRVFQKDAGLTITGAAEEETQKALRQAVADGMEKKVPKEGDFWGDIPHFTRKEFACKCANYHAPYCDGYPAEPKEALVRLAEAIRQAAGVPVTVVSGLRCPRHNADSGGVANSQHMDGTAADIHAQGLGGEQLLAIVRQMPGVRYCYRIPGSDNVHFDIPR